MKRLAWRVAFLLALAVPMVPGAAERFITVASTTSTENSGLFRHILSLFERKAGIGVRVVALGTGQALRVAERGDADVLLVHHRPSEDKFVNDGFGVNRRDVMYNDFVLIGPGQDPAGIRGLKDAVEAVRRIGARRAAFASRGDDSGTHKAELALWQAAGIDIGKASGAWYRETGSGMGATLNTARGLGAYALTDRGTWASFRNKGDLDVLCEGDPRLFNPYGVILVNPARHPHVKVREGLAFIDWLVSAEGQAVIADFRIDGLQIFFPGVR